jgi:endonuclease/exonuclease/phosphatase family metal-dependent hydrolase
MALRVVSYNVRYFGHALRGLASTLGIKRRIAGALLKLEPRPDIICLQEVETTSLRSTMMAKRASEAETQLDAFMRRMEELYPGPLEEFPYEAFYFRAHTFGSEKMPLYTTGLAVLINVRTLKVEGHNCDSPEHITHHHVARWKDRKQSRICGHLRVIEKSGRAIHIFNTHLSLPTPFDKQFWSNKDKMGFGVNQLHEARTLAGFVHKHAGQDAFILCGDFNSAPGSPVFQYLTAEARFVCAQQSLGKIDPKVPRGFPTAGFMHLRMHLDHLFSSANVQWIDLDQTSPFGEAGSPFHGLSDHVPLIGRFDVAH